MQTAGLPSWASILPGSHGHTGHHIWACLQCCPCDAFLASSRCRCTLFYSDEDSGPLHQLKVSVGLWFEKERLSFPKNHQVRWDMEENWPLNRQEQKAKIPRPHRASRELSVEGRPGLWLFCPPDSPQGHVHHPGHLAVPLTWGFPPAPRVSLPEDATGLNRAQHAWLRPGAPNPTFPGTAGDPGAHWGTGGWEGAEPHRAETSEAGSGPEAMRKLRSLLPWTAVWEDFLGLASLRDHWVAVRGFLFCFGEHLEMQSYWYFLSLELQHQLQDNLWKHLQAWIQLHLYCPPEV